MRRLRRVDAHCDSPAARFAFTSRSHVTRLRRNTSLRGDIPMIQVPATLGKSASPVRYCSIHIIGLWIKGMCYFNHRSWLDKALCI